jgi:hypothetical protein
MGRTSENWVRRGKTDKPRNAHRIEAPEVVAWDELSAKNLARPPAATKWVFYEETREPGRKSTIRIRSIPAFLVSS